MNPIWIAIAATVALPAAALTVIGLRLRHESKRERALSRRRKKKIDLLNTDSEPGDR